MKGMMRKSIKNYTSTVTVEKSVRLLQEILVEHGAKNIIFDYEDKILVGIKFLIDVKGQTLAVKLPE